MKKTSLFGRMALTIILMAVFATAAMAQTNPTPGYVITNNGDTIMSSPKPQRIVVNQQIDLEQSFDGEKSGYIFAPYNNPIKCIEISCNGIEYDIGVSDNHIIKYITTSDKRFSVDGYKIGDEITKTHTIIGWGHYAKINEEWYAAWFSENRNDKSGKIEWFFKYDFNKPLFEKEFKLDKSKLQLLYE